MAYPGKNVTFNCVGDMIEHVQWLGNGILLDDAQENVHIDFFPIHITMSGRGTLTLTNLTQEKNNTQIRCMATLHDRSDSVSNISILLIQGLK